MNGHTSSEALRNGNRGAILQFSPEHATAKGHLMTESMSDEYRARRAMLDVPRRRPGFGGVLFGRRLTTAEQLDLVLLRAAEQEYLESGDFSALRELRLNLGTSAPQAQAAADPLDRVRVWATLIMVAALFAIVWVVAVRPNPTTGATQLVSLASGLAGIGLGWLFGTGTVGPKRR